MSDIVNYYEILGVTPQATIEEIKVQRNRMLLAYHPDHNKSSSANEITRRINEAWETLSDPERRFGYDEILKSTCVEGAPRHRESSGKIKKPSRRTAERTKAYTPAIQRLMRRWQVVGVVERNLFETSSGNLYYVKVWRKPLPSFFGLSAKILREYGSTSLHVIFYHASEGFYVDLPFELLSSRLDQLSYQRSLQQYKVHFIQRDSHLILKELDLPVNPYYLRGTVTEEKIAINWKKRLKKAVRIVFVALKIAGIILIVGLVMLNLLGGRRRRLY
jgi:curved DNA-binding protein CbpA